MNRSAAATATPARLARLLARCVPRECAEVLAPAIEWRCSAGRATAVIANPIWLEVFVDQAEDALGERLRRDGVELRVLSPDELPTISDHTPVGLDDLLQDPGNQFAISTSRQVVEAPGVVHNPLYFHGPPGCGKSALLAAIAGEFANLLGDDQVLHFEGRVWVAQLAQELSSKPGSLRERLEQAACICFDDVHELANRSLAQEHLYHLINLAMDQGQQLVFTGAAAPPHLAGLEDRLQTRLSWGLTVAIDQPMLETRIALVRRLAGTAAAELDPADLTRRVEALAPDMRQARHLAERLARGEAIDLGQDQASFDRVLESVARRYGIRAGDIAGKRRHRPVAQARQTALLLGRRLTGHSLEALGGMVGGRDHSTVLYGIRQAEERLARDEDYRREIAQLTQEALRESFRDE